MSKFMEAFGLRTQSVSSYRDILDHPDQFDAADLRQATLVTGDPYYAPLYAATLEATGSHAEAVEAVALAGCFDDQMESRPTADAWFLSAPYNLLARRYQEGQRNIVLVGTGSYDPMHNGHVAMMTLTRNAFEAIPGVRVVGAVMSSSHDSYVRRYKTPDGPPQEERIQRNQIFLENHPDNQDPWIIHDCWETMGVPLAVNFTDVLNHIQAMVDLHVGPDVELVYVFGSDTQGFSGAFTHGNEALATGACVVRPGYPVREDVAALDGIRVVEGGLDESSTRIRAAARNPFLIRADAQHATDYLEEKIPDYGQRIHAFQVDLREVLSTVHDPIGVLDVDEQLRITKEHLALHYPEHEVLTSDVYFTEGMSIRSSRLFHPVASQHHGHGTTSVPSVAQEPGKPYVFVDDDICSGFFLMKIRQAYRIDEALSMAKLTLPGEHLDIVDERDFLIGARHGGLMMDLHEGVRFPYLAPFVNLTTRASVPPERIRDVNAALWRINENFYAGTGVLAKDVENTDFITVIGLENHPLEQVCALFKERFSS